MPPLLHCEAPSAPCSVRPLNPLPQILDYVSDVHCPLYDGRKTFSLFTFQTDCYCYTASCFCCYLMLPQLLLLLYRQLLFCYAASCFCLCCCLMLSLLLLRMLLSFRQLLLLPLPLLPDAAATGTVIQSASSASVATLCCKSCCHCCYCCYCF